MVGIIKISFFPQFWASNKHGHTEFETLVLNVYQECLLMKKKKNQFAFTSNFNQGQQKSNMEALGAW